MADDLRNWLEKMDSYGELSKIEGADWDEEIGCLTGLSRKTKGRALLFDEIKGYPAGFRIVTGTLSTHRRVALTLGIPKWDSKLELLEILRRKIPTWLAKLDDYHPKFVSSGTLLQNIHSREDIDLFEFPVPKWHQPDGGRYIGTGDAVITRDPDNGQINLGTYRVMVQDSKTLGLYIAPGNHGRIHLEKYHARGEPCPVAVSVGHHPLVYGVACTSLPEGVEYSFLGAITGEPFSVITEEVTGLPVPADSEIVLAGWCPPDELRDEGIFGEWTGYYGGEREPRPIIKVERVYHRDNPVILGQPPELDFCWSSIFKSAVLFNELIDAGVPDLMGAYVSDFASGKWVVISIKQRYAGHAKRAAMEAAFGRVSAWLGRYTIVVDEDVDPTNIDEVLQALCFRVDPGKDVDIIRDCWSTPLDPIIRRPTQTFSTSRAVINACKPYEWKDRFPKSVVDDPEVAARVKQKWGNLL